MAKGHTKEIMTIRPSAKHHLINKSHIMFTIFGLTERDYPSFDGNIIMHTINVSNHLDWLIYSSCREQPSSYPAPGDSFGNDRH